MGREFKFEMQDLQTKIDNLKSDRNDFIASAGRYWQEDDGVQKWLALVDQEIARLEKLHRILTS